MTIELFAMHDEAGRLILFVDSRDAAGNLVASEPFHSREEAERYAARLEGSHR